MTGENLAIFDQLANDIVKKRILEFKELFIKEKNRSKYQRVSFSEGKV